MYIVMNFVSVGWYHTVWWIQETWNGLKRLNTTQLIWNQDT